MATALRTRVEEALKTLDDNQAFERLVRRLVAREWVVQPPGSADRGTTDGGSDFIAWRPEDPNCKWAGQIYHPVSSSPGRAYEKVRQKLGATRRKLRQEGTHPGNLILVTSAKLTPREIQNLHRLDTTENLLVLDGSWIVNELVERRDHAGIIEDYLGITRSDALIRPRRYLETAFGVGSQRTRSDFVGRQIEVETLRRAVSTSDVVLVVGQGGVGKSRLVAEAAVSDEAVDASTREWYFVAHSAVGSMWQLELPAGRESVVVLDDPQRIPEFTSEVAKLVQADGPRVRLVLTLRPDKEAEVRSLLPPGLGSTRIQTGRLSPAEIDAMLTTLGIRTERERAGIVASADGNPQVASLLAQFRMPGTHIATVADGMSALIRQLVGTIDGPTNALLSFVACFTHLPLFVSSLPTSDLADDSAFARRGRRLREHLAALVGGQAEVDRLLDELIDTGFMERQESRHGARLVVRPDILAEALVSQRYFSRDGGPECYRREVTELAREMDLERETRDRLASVARAEEGSSRAKEEIALVCERLLQDLEQAPPSMRYAALHELKSLVVAVPEKALVAARIILSPAAEEESNSELGSELAIVAGVVGLLETSLNYGSPQAQGEATKLLLQMADPSNASARARDVAREAILNSVDPQRCRTLERIDLRLQAIGQWWREEPSRRSPIYGDILTRTSLAEFDDFGPVAADPNSIRISRVCLLESNESVREHWKRLATCIASLASASPIGLTAAVRVVASITDQVLRMHAGPVFRQFAKDATDSVALRVMEDVSAVNVVARDILFDLTCRIANHSDASTEAIERLRWALVADEELRLYRHLSPGLQRWDDEGREQEIAWRSFDEDAVLLKVARECTDEAALARLLARLDRLVRDARTEPGAMPYLGWLGVLVVRACTDQGPRVVRLVSEIGTPDLRAIGCGALGELWLVTPRRARIEAERLITAASAGHAEIIMGSLWGQLAPEAWSLLMSWAAKADVSIANLIVESSLGWRPPAGCHLADLLLPLAGILDSPRCVKILDRLAPPGVLDAHRATARPSDADAIALLLGRVLGDAELGHQDWWLWQWVKWLAETRPSTFVDALLARVQAEDDRPPRFDPLPPELGTCAACLPHGHDARARLVDTCMSWLEGRQEPSASWGERILQDVLTPEEVQLACSRWRAEWRSHLRELSRVAPWLDGTQVEQFIANLATDVPRALWWRLENILREHIEPFGRVHERGSYPEPMSQVASRLVLADDARTRVFGEWLQGVLRLERGEVERER